MSNNENHIARRDFLKIAGVGGAGLLIGSTGVGGTFLASQYFAKDKTGVKNKINFYGKYQSGITTEQQKHVYFVVLSINKMSISDVKEMFKSGDICIQACSDDPQVNFHAIRNLIRVAKGEVSMKWSQAGFNSFEEKDGKKETPRNLFSFKDGTGNPNVQNKSDLNEYVFIQDGWAKNGSYLVARRIQMLLETWDRTALGEQEATFARYRHSGAPIGKEKEFDTFDPDIKDKNGENLIEKESHVSLAKAAKTNLLRRSFSYSDGINANTGTFDAGLLFLSFQKSPEQFIKIQSKMGAIDKLNEYITHRGSGIFLCLPGVQEGGYLGETLFNRI